MRAHKAGKLKQDNKKHKLHGKTKSSGNNPIAGRVESKRPQPKARVNHIGSKQDRMNRQKQLMQEKRLANFRLRRQNISSVNRIVAVFPLHANVSIDSFKAALGATTSGDFTLVENESLPTIATYRCKSQKCNFQFLFDPSFESLMDPMWSMELLGVSDSVLLLTDYDLNDISPLLGDVGEKNLQLMSAFGSSNPVVVSINRGNGPRLNLKNVPKKWKYDVDHFVQQTEAVGVTKYLDINEHNLSNVLSDNTKKSLRWRNQRSYMMSPKVTIEPQEIVPGEEQASPKFKVVMEGCLRGVPMYAHSLVHICGVGTGRITRIEQQELLQAAHDSEEQANANIFIDREKQDDLVVEATPDELLGEQTWPTEDEMQDNDVEDLEEEEDDGMDEEKDDEEEMDQLSGGEDDEDEDKVETMEDFIAGIKQLDGSAQKKTNSQLMQQKRGVRFAGDDEDNDGAQKKTHGMDDDDEEEEDLDHHPGEKLLMSRGQRRQMREEAGVPEDVVDDYVDTPADTPARSRFARYRALQSFRSSYWNPKENLPPQYGRIFQFDDMKGMQRRLHHQLTALRRLQMDPLVAAAGSSANSGNNSSKGNRSRTQSASSTYGGEGGMDMEGDDDDDNATAVTSATSASAQALTLEDAEDYIRSDQLVTIELADVPAAVVATYKRQGYLVWYALHGFEYKCSVLHYQIRRVNPVVNRQENIIADEEIVKSKDLLLFHTGFRAFWARPIFSEPNLNSEKSKFLRYLPRTVTTMGEGGPGTDASALLDASTIERNAAANFVSASVIGPVNMTVTNAPVLVFKYDTDQQQWKLIANGAMTGVEPDRVILKKIVLYGNPIRVRKRTAVIRHMLYDPSDVKWFQPAELTTLMGLRGHIKESVGTHGLFKAIFSAAISQNDQVNLVLYKRVYPKIPTVEDLPYGNVLTSSSSQSSNHNHHNNEELKQSLDKGWPLLFM